MTKHELLVPAGDMASLYQAVANGADAVYLGCKSFGARKFAKNFDNEEILEALKYAHLYGVKVYVTMNTLVKDDEVMAFLEQVEFLHKHKVDAILIQDFGMLCLVREKYPNLEVHASTQANTSSKATAQLFYQLGVKRVVFSREMTLDEINAIDVPIEKEVFIHGALCISYSGCCLMSSMLGTRSGNRGECAGSCRLPYTLKKGQKTVKTKQYLLSTKELNTAPKISALLDSNITSFKIEGRMKSPEYVGFITNYYRRLIDGKKLDLLEETDKLKTIFNRDFTTGNLFATPAKDLMNPKTPNHIGLEIGQVIETTKDKIKIKLTKPLNQHDGIRFLNSKTGFIVNYLYDKNHNLTNHVEDICYVDNKIGLDFPDIVCKTQDSVLLNSLTLLPSRKVPISITVNAKIDKPLEMEISDGINVIKEYGNKIAKAISAPITEDRIITQLEKLGNTPFVSYKTLVNSDDDIFISIKELNDLRRTLVTKLIALRTNSEQAITINSPAFSPTINKNLPGLTATVRTEEQLQTCLDLGFKSIYVADKIIYQKYKDNSKVYYQLPHCIRNLEENMTERCVISDFCEVSPQITCIGNYPLNVYNIYTVYYLHQLQVDRVILSVELSESEQLALIDKYISTFNASPNVEIYAYGRIENMLIKGNIFEIIPSEKDYCLVDSKNRVFPVFYDGINTHILNYENFMLNNSTYKKASSSLHFDFYNETKKTIEKIVNSYQ